MVSLKKVLAAVTVWVLLLSLAACSRGESGVQSESAGNEGSGEKSLSVVTTIFPPYDFTREIAGDNVKLKMLLPPGSESHSFEPTPKDLIEIQNCDVFIYTGGESDSWVDSILDSMEKDFTVLKMMDMAQVMEEETVEGMETEEEEEHDGGYEYDEHVWTSPVNAQLIVKGISDALIYADPQNTELYRSNTEKYIEALKQLDKDFHSVTDNADIHTLVFGDRFPFLYFAKEYNLSYYAAFPGCSAETEPSAKTVAFLIDKINQEGIPAVFHIEFSSEKMADSISESTGTKKLLLHSCHNVSKEDIADGVSYLDLMQRNAETLKEALWRY